MDLRRPLRYPLLAAGLLALAALGAACDDGGDAAGPEATPTTAAPASTPTPAPEASAEATAPSAFPLTVEDSGGAAITLDAPPTRIVSYSPGATEILFAIGAGERVIATDEFSDFPAAALDLPKLAYSSPDPEGALALDPDLVLMAGQQRDQVEQFRSLGMTVLFVEEAANLEGVLDRVELFGSFTGNQERAAALVTEMQGRIDAVTSALADVEEGPRVLFELTSDLYTIAPDTFVGDLLTLAKARNIAEGAESRFPQLTAEAVVVADPEVVLLAHAEFSGESLETVCARPGWDVITACTSGRVEAVDGDLTNRPGPRVVDGLELIARLLYPERFP